MTVTNAVDCAEMPTLQASQQRVFDLVNAPSLDFFQEMFPVLVAEHDLSQEATWVELFEILQAKSLENRNEIWVQTSGARVRVLHELVEEYDCLAKGYEIGFQVLAEALELEAQE